MLPLEELSESILEPIDQICMRFEQAWEDGEPPSILTFLESIDEPYRERLFWELLQLEREIRAEKSGPNCDTPIIGLTAHIMAQEHTECIEAGMNAFLMGSFEQFADKLWL